MLKSCIIWYNTVLNQPVFYVLNHPRDLPVLFKMVHMLETDQLRWKKVKKYEFNTILNHTCCMSEFKRQMGSEIA